MTSTGRTAWTGDDPAERLLLEWLSPEGADERFNAREAVQALFGIAEGWIEVLGLEIRASCFDLETFVQTAYVNPPRAFHLLVRQPRPPDVRIEPTYRAVRTAQGAINRDVVATLVERLLDQSCGDPSRYETALGELTVHASRIPLPPAWSGAEVLPLECYAGTVNIQLEQSDGTAWVAAPPSRYLLRQPVALSVMNTDDALSLSIEVYWSPWVGELSRPGSPLFDGVARLEARGWTRI